MCVLVLSWKDELCGFRLGGVDRPGATKQRPSQHSPKVDGSALRAASRPVAKIRLSARMARAVIDAQNKSMEGNPYSYGRRQMRLPKNRINSGLDRLCG